MVDQKRRKVGNVLLTGATGVLGGRVLLEVLHQMDANVYCLVRAPNVVAGMQRLQKILSVYDPHGHHSAEIEARVIPVLGDITQDKLGMKYAEYDDLAMKVDLMIHGAASVNLIASYNKLAPINVKGTEHAVEFCLTGVIPLVYVSSYSVIGSRLYEENFVFRESHFDVGQKFYDGMSYEESKFEAERLVRQCTAKGLHWVIVRPGNIFGDSETGCYPLAGVTEVGIYYSIIKTIVETGYCFNNTENFDITPVDYVAKALLYAGIHISATHGKTYHLTNPRCGTFNDLTRLLRECRYTIRELSPEKYFAALFEERMMRDGRPYSSRFTSLLSLVEDDEDLVEYARFDTSEIQALTCAGNVDFPRVDVRLMQRYINYCIQVGFLDPPERQAHRLATIVSASGEVEQCWS